MKSERDSIAALMWEIHAEIESAARNALSGVGSSLAPLSVTYPPNEKLTSEETKSLRDLVLTAEQRSGLTKLIADAASGAFFRAFCLMDGVGDPEHYSIDEWYGLRLTPAGAEDEDTDMLHDTFFDSWRDWKGNGRTTRRTKSS